MKELHELLSQLEADHQLTTELHRLLVKIAAQIHKGNIRPITHEARTLCNNLIDFINEVG